MPIRLVTTNAPKLRSQLKVFERRYGVPSDRLADAFRSPSGQIEETEDYTEWSSLYTAWRLAVSTSRES